MKFIALLCLLLWLPSQQVWAQWDVSQIRTLGEECLLDTSIIDDSKLTLRFSRFASVLEQAAAQPRSVAAQCSIEVSFTVPARHKVVTLTHRAFAQVTKNKASRVTMEVNLNLNEQAFAFSGRIPEGSALDQKVLLYKSFKPVDDLARCHEHETKISVILSWDLHAEAAASGGRARLSLSGEELWTDSWIETRPCDELAHASALNDA